MTADPRTRVRSSKVDSTSNVNRPPRQCQLEPDGSNLQPSGSSWAIDREIVLSRVIAAPRERVFQAWTDPSQIARWFGPDGFKVESLECDIRPGGRWRFVYTSPDGTRYDNRMVFLRLEAPRLIEMEHGSDKDNDPARFYVTVTFDAQSDGKTVLTMRQLHPTRQQRDAGIGFGAVELGYQTLGKLARHLGAG